MATISETVRREVGKFTPTERRVAHELLRTYPSAGLETVAEFARRAGTSGPSILRFIGKLGFRNYSDFQTRLRDEVTAVLQSPLARYPSAGANGGTGSQIAFDRAVLSNIEQGMSLLAAAEIAALLEILADDRRALYLVGGRFSGANALWLFQLLREIRRNVHLVDGQAHRWVEQLVDMNRKSVLIAFDFRRYQEDVVAFAQAAAEQGTCVVAVTDEWMSPIAAFADHVITSPVAVPSLFDSTIASLAQMESLVARLGERLAEKGRNRIAAIEKARRSVAGDGQATAPGSARRRVRPSSPGGNSP